MSMTIVEKLNKLKTQLASIKTAIQNKGVSVGNDMSTWASAVDSIQTGQSDEELMAVIKNLINPNYDNEIDKTFIVPENISSAKSYAFSYLPYTTVNLNNITTLGEYSFYNAKMKNIVMQLPCIIRTRAFCGSYILNITLPEGCTLDGTALFTACKNLQEITIPSSITILTDSIFQNCTSLERVNLPDSINRFVSYTFSGCTSLKTFTIHSTVTNIGGYTFYNCSNLETVFYKSTQQYITSSQYGGCTSLKLLDLSSATQVFRFGSSATSTTVGTSSYIHIHDGLQIVVPKSLYNEWKASQYWVNFVDYLYWRDDDGNLQNTPVE